MSELNGHFQSEMSKMNIKCYLSNTRWMKFFMALYGVTTLILIYAIITL